MSFQCFTVVAMVYYVIALYFRLIHGFLNHLRLPLDESLTHVTALSLVLYEFVVGLTFFFDLVYIVNK